MSVSIDDFVGAIEKIAPADLAYDWDNTGLLLRCGDDITRVLITLDITSAVIDEAQQKGCDMILSHHPLMFEPVKRLSYSDAGDAFLMRLIKEGISLYAAHTSFDRAEGGINDILARRLMLCDIEKISGPGEDLIRTGKLKKALDKEQLVEHVKKTLGADVLRLSRSGKDEIRKIAVAGGSGGAFVETAKKLGADALLTGEAKHHHFIQAEALSILLLEAGHFHTERYFIEEAFKSLQSCMDEVQLTLELIKANNLWAPYEYV